MFSREVGDLDAAEHARDLLDTLFATQQLNRTGGMAIMHDLGNAPLLGRASRYLRQMGYAHHLMASTQRPEHLPHDLRDATANSAIHFIKDQCRYLRHLRCHGLDRQRDSGKFTAGSDL